MADARQELEELRRLDELERKANAQLKIEEPSAQKDGIGWDANLVSGMLRGAGSIGATLLSPLDAAARAVGIENSWIGRRDRRQAMDEGLRSLGADPESAAFQVGKIGTEIAATAPIGGILGRGAQKIGSPVLAQALAGGSAPLASRVVGGAATGGASAALVNPEDAESGAMFGAALPLALGAGKLGAVAGRKLIGSLTGAGDDALRVAYESGVAGGNVSQAFRDSMRGVKSMTDVLDDAKANLATMRANRAAEYKTNMSGVRSDKTVLDMTPIQQSLNDVFDKFTFKGQARNPQVTKALKEVEDEIQSWSQLNPKEFHTAEGLDALKQRINAILQTKPYEATDVRSAIGDVYKSIKNQIEKQAPEYSKAMKDYTKASELLDEITKSLSLGNRSTADTAMRKLQSVMRNNVNTNYGLRAGLVNELEQQGGRQLMPQLAGQALNDWIPRGIQRASGPGLSLGAGALGGFPAALSVAAASSPRLMGEASYYAGRLDPIVRALRRQLQLGAPIVGPQLVND